MYDRESHTLVGDIIFFVGIGLLIIFVQYRITYLGYIKTWMSYHKYISNSEMYDVVKGNITKSSDLGSQIGYYYNGNKHFVWSEMFPEYQAGDTVDIAVNKDNYNDVERGRKYSLFFYPWGKQIIMLLCLIAYFGYLNYCIGWYDTHASWDFNKQKGKENKKYRQSENEIDRENLLKHYYPNHQDKLSDLATLKNQLKLMDALGLYYDLELILQTISVDELILKGFLFRKNSNNEFEFMRRTLEAWENRHLTKHILLREMGEDSIVYRIEDDCIYCHHQKNYRYEFVAGSLSKYLVSIKDTPVTVGYIGEDKMTSF